MINVYQYCRVSSESQNISRQLEQFKEYNKANDINTDNGYNVIIIEEVGSARTIENRDKLKLLLNVLHESDILMICQLDRLSRNYKDIRNIWKELTDKGVDIVVLDMELLDTRLYKDTLGTFVSDLILSVLSYNAQKENEYRAYRQKQGIEIAKLKGVYKGRIPIKIDDEKFISEYDKFNSGSQTADTTANNLGISRATFYRRIKQYKEKGIIK